MPLPNTAANQALESIDDKLSSTYDNTLVSGDQAFVANQVFSAISVGEGRLSIQLESGDTFSGSVKLQVSNDGVVYRDVVDDSEDVVEAPLSDDGCIINIDSLHTLWVRPVYIGTDTGTATVTVVNKGGL